MTRQPEPFRRAAANAETNYQQALEITGQRSAQRRAAPKVGYESVRLMPGIIRKGQNGLSDGRIKFLLRSKKGFFRRPTIVGLLQLPQIKPLAPGMGRGELRRWSVI